MEYPHIPGSMEMKVLDFRAGSFGLLVVRSDHWYKEHCQKIPRSRETGIVVDTKFYQDSKGRIICWPVIHWEGSVCSSMTHPMNAQPFRKKQQLPIITMDDGQWGTNGPPDSSLNSHDMPTMP